MFRSRDCAKNCSVILKVELSKPKWPRTFEFVTEALRDDAGKVRRSQLRQERLNAN